METWWLVLAGKVAHPAMTLIGIHICCKQSPNGVGVAVELAVPWPLIMRPGQSSYGLSVLPRRVCMGGAWAFQ